MAPKKAGKAAAKAKDKAVEDKTFGLKNKKGAKQQKFVEQVKKSHEATAARGNRGPSKKELKEIQKAQEEEMMALFNIVPKKNEDDENKNNTDEMDPDAGPTFTDITQEIEYQRANVVAKTKITDEVFQAWRAKKMAARKDAEEAAQRERHRKGILTGREIFMQASNSFVDDDDCADDEDMMREIDDDEEIKRMEALSLAAQREARRAAGFLDDDDDENAGPSTSAGPAGHERGHVKATGADAGGAEMTAAEQAELFDDDDDDDIDLDELENQVKSKS